MITENLQDMVSGINERTANGMSEYDIILRHSAKPKELPAASQKESEPGHELEVLEKSEPLVSEIPAMGTIEMPEAKLVNEYRPESEEALIDYVNSQNSKLEMANILVKWEIGRCINSFYQGKYGARELEKISKETGIGINSLHKMCRFARIYRAEQLQLLLRGNYILTWFDIAQNLAVEPIRVIHTFELSKNYDDFLIQIKRLKDPDEKRGKSKPSKRLEAKIMGIEKPEPLNIAPTEITVAVIPDSVEAIAVEKPTTVVSEITPCMPDKEIFPDNKEPDKEVDPDELAKQCQAYETELKILKLENEQLKKEILSKDVKVKELEKKLSDVQQEKEKYENSYYSYMDKLDKTRKALEDNTPVGAILAWMDQGDDE